MNRTKHDLQQETDFILTAGEIDNAAEQVTNILKEFRIPQKDILRISLMVESLLISIMDHSAGSEECHFSFQKRLGRGKISIQYGGSPFNPITEDNDESLSILFENLGIPCTWKYENASNIITLFVKKRLISNTKLLLLSIFMAILCGLLSSRLPENIRTVLSSSFLSPFRGTYLGLLNGVAVVFLFFNVTAGLCGDKRTSSLRKQSRIMIYRLPVMLTALTAVGYLILLLSSSIRISHHSAGTWTQTEEVIKLLWGMIPSNIINAFADGNYIHILIFALMFGTALSTVREQFPELVAMVSGLNNVLMTIIEKICKLIPLFIFCSLLNLFMTSNSLAGLSDIWKPIIIFVLLSIIMIILVLVVLSLMYKCNAWCVLKAMFPAWLVSVITASRMAAYSMNVDILEKRLGVSKKFSILGLTISGKLYPVGVSLYIAVMVIYFAEKYAVNVSPGWLASALLLTVLLTFAGPPIPGELIVIFSIISKQLNFPAECLVILATVDVFLDGLATGTSCILRNAEMIFEAGSFNELNKEALRQL